MFGFLKRWTKSEHEFCQENLSAFLDGQLTPREHSYVERHLSRCAACRAELEALRQTVDLLRTVPVMKPPRSFLLPVNEAVRQRQARRRRLAYVSLQAATAIATVLLVLVVSGDVLLRYRMTQFAPHTLGARPEVTMLVETTVAREGQDLWVPAAVPQQPSELPNVMPSESLAVSEAKPTATEQILPDNQAIVAKAMPSKTFAKAAAPPVPPTLASDVESSPVPTEPIQATSTPQMTATATPTAMPKPTNTPVPPTPTVQVPTLQAVLGETQDQGQLPPAVGPWTFLEVVRPFMFWIELALALTVTMLLVATLWLRRKQHPV